MVVVFCAINKRATKDQDVLMIDILNCAHRKSGKAWLTEVFNHGFRRGANDRAQMGLALGPDNYPPSETPSPDIDSCDSAEQELWRSGYAMGFQVGASDAELASTDVPGAHGLLSGFSESFLEQMGFFKPEAYSGVSKQEE